MSDDNKGCVYCICDSCDENVNINGSCSYCPGCWDLAMKTDDAQKSKTDCHKFRKIQVRFKPLPPPTRRKGKKMTNKELIEQAKGAEVNCLKNGKANEADLYRSLAERIKVTPKRIIVNDDDGYSIEIRIRKGGKLRFIASDSQHRIVDICGTIPEVLMSLFNQEREM